MNEILKKTPEGSSGGISRRNSWRNLQSKLFERSLQGTPGRKLKIKRIAPGSSTEEFSEETCDLLQKMVHFQKKPPSGKSLIKIYKTVLKRIQLKLLKEFENLRRNSRKNKSGRTVEGFPGHMLNSLKMEFQKYFWKNLSKNFWEKTQKELVQKFKRLRSVLIWEGLCHLLG